jgi:hypothetical protein
MECRQLCHQIVQKVQIRKQLIVISWEIQNCTEISILYEGVGSSCALSYCR